MKNLYLFLILVCLSSPGIAQTASSYGFTSLFTPFESIAPTGTEAFTVETEDDTQIGIPIGFNFTYCGVTYNSLSACSNGWISLSMTDATYSAEFINSDFTIDDGDFILGTLPGTGQGWLMPYWDDLDGTLGNAYFTTTGFAPNRVFTFEWNNWSPSGFGFGTGLLTFQVKLYESTNIIDFCYGAPTFFSDCDGTIGIANDQVSDWQTLTNEGPFATPTPFFVDFLAGSPVDGQVFRWTPPSCAPAAITGTPTVCSGFTTTLADATAGGTWSSSTPAVGTVDASTGEVTGISGGTTVISYITGPGCFATLVVTVNAADPITGTPAVCQGSSTTLTSGPPGGTWGTGLSSIATVTASGTVTGVLGGTTTISYTTADGCFTTVEFSVNPLPAPITGGAGMCIGTTTTLSSTTSGGTWSSSTPAVATVDASSGLVSAVSLGTADITYTLATGCYRTTVVTVNLSVAPITGSLVTCVGSTTTLSSTTAGGTWSSTANASVDVLTGVVTGITPGTATVTYSLGGGCLTTAEVSINPAPSAILGTLVVCPSFTSLLSHAITGGTWASSNANASIGLSSGILTGNTGGTSVITYTLPAASGSCIVTAIATVNPNPNPITGTLSVCEGSTTALSTTTPFVFWSSANTSVATVGTSSGVVAGLTPGTASISASIGGCSISVIVTVNPLPAAIGGTLTLCVSGTTTLTNPSSGGAWTSSNLPVAFISGPGPGVIGGASAGTATISYTLSTGCYRTAEVTVNPLPPTITGNTGVCVGATTVLSSGVGGTWSSSTPANGTINASTGVVTGIAAGTTTISYTLPTGCFRTRTENINPLPAAISGASALCPTTTITLSNATSGGAWSSLNPGIATVAAGSGLVTGVATGFATINYTLPTGCLTFAVVTVNPAPPAVITALGDTALCPGDFVTLTASTSAGVTYQWYEGGTAIPGAISSTYLTGTAGSYQVKVSQTGGCSIFSIPMSVSVVPASASISLPGGSSSGCSGAGVVLDGIAGTGLSYQWQLDGAPIAGATNASYTALTSGDYSLVVSNTTGCSAVSSPEAIVINPVPAGVVTLSGPLSVCAGATVVMTAEPGLTYQWHNTSGPIPGATAMSYTASVAGNYWVVETNSSGCSTASVPNAVSINPLPDASITHPGSNLVFCVGGTANLFGVPGGGFTYQWYKDGIVIAGATNSSFIATATGAYKIKVTNPATGCVNMSATSTDITAVGAVTITPVTPSHFCWGGSSLLSTSVSAVGSAVSYQWLLAGSAIPGATNSTYNATVAGDYSCTISVPASCVVTSSTIHVYENPLPDPLVSFDGTVFHTGNFYVSYQWYKNLVMIPGATSAATPATSIGNYKVAVTDTNGCQSVSTAYVLSEWHGPSTGITTVNGGEVRIYPNPAKMMVHIESNVPVSAVVTGIDGRQLMSVSSATDIDVSKLANGIYMIMIYDNGHHLLKAEKLIKSAE